MSIAYYQPCLPACRPAWAIRVRCPLFLHLPWAATQQASLVQPFRIFASSWKASQVPTFGTQTTSDRGKLADVSGLFFSRTRPAIGRGGPCHAAVQMTKGHNPRKHVLTSVHHPTLGSLVLNGTAYVSRCFLHHSEHNSGWICLCTAFLLGTGAECGRCRKQGTGGTKRPEDSDGRARGEQRARAVTEHTEPEPLWIP